MAINISNLQNQAHQLSSAKNGDKPGQAVSDSKEKGLTASNSKAQASGSDPVVLTAEAKQLGALQQQLVDAPSEKSDKIAALKQAVADGSYQVNPQGLAKKMSGFEAQLNSNLFG